MAVCSKCGTFIPQAQGGVCPKCKHNEEFTSKVESSTQQKKRNDFRVQRTKSNDAVKTQKVDGKSESNKRVEKKKRISESRHDYMDLPPVRKSRHSVSESGTRISQDKKPRRPASESEIRVSQKESEQPNRSKIILGVIIVALVASLGVFAYFHFFSDREPNEDYVESNVEVEPAYEPEAEPEPAIELEGYIGVWVASLADSIMKLELYDSLLDEVYFDIWVSETMFIPFTATLVENTADISSSGRENVQGSLSFVGELIVMDITESDNLYLPVGTMSFIRATDESWSEEEDANSYISEIEEKVEQIRQWFNETHNNPNLTASQLGNLRRYYNQYGELVRVIDFIHGNSESYYFNNGRLYFAFFVFGADEDRLYFHDDIMFRWIDRDGRILDNAFNYMGYNLIWEYAIDMAYDLYHLQFPTGTGDGAGNTFGAPFRVMWDWGDPTSQIGYFEVVENAINYARRNNRRGVRVYDTHGNMVYDPIWCDCPICEDYRNISPPY